MDFNVIAEEHATLLEGIARFDDASTSLQEQQDILKTLEQDLNGREDKLRELGKKRKSEHKDLDELQRSALKRLMTRVRHGGKEGLEKRLEKEEMEYIEAAQAEHLESQAISDLTAAIAEAKDKIDEHTAQVEQRKEWIRRLDDIYRAAFTGPTEQFPEEDTAEETVRIAEVHYEEMQGALAREESVVAILKRATRSADLALNALERANRAATYDTLGVGGRWAEIAERDELCKAQTLASEAERHLAQARNIRPDMPSVRKPELVRTDWLNVVFDNLYTDYVFQQKIQKSIQSLTSFQQSVHTLCATAESRLAALRQPARDAQSYLTHARRELLNVRRDILTQLAEERRDRAGGVGRFGLAEGGSGEQLPVYTAPAGMPLPRYESGGGAPAGVPPPTHSVPAPRYESGGAGPAPAHPPAPGLSRALSQTAGTPGTPAPGVSDFPWSSREAVVSSPLGTAGTAPRFTPGALQAMAEPVASPSPLLGSPRMGSPILGSPPVGSPRAGSPLPPRSPRAHSRTPPIPSTGPPSEPNIPRPVYAPPPGPPPGHPSAARTGVDVAPPPLPPRRDVHALAEDGRSAAQEAEAEAARARFASRNPYRRT